MHAHLSHQTVNFVDPNVFETANAGFAQAMYEEFLRDPAAVGPEWRKLFESGVVGEKPSPNGQAVGRSGGQAAVGTPAESEGVTLHAHPDATARPPDRPTAPGASPVKGPAAKLVANMEQSLTVPTATTFRVVPVGVLEERRRRLNGALQTAGRRDKISFTHLIAWALVQATKQHPVMGHTLIKQDGTPYRVQPEGIGLGLAVDVQRKDGSRGLVVPVIQRAETMDFAAFHAAYEAAVDKARNNRLMPDDFAGATMTLTNPGGLGTVASVPRLMAGQGSIIAVGAIGYPVEFSAVPEERLREFGISKVMTVTSTYDHRVIQGAESGSFLATVEALLQGDQGFYELVEESLQLSDISYQVVKAAPAAKREEAAGPVAPEMLYHVAAAMALVKAFRMHGHLAAQLDPLGTPPIGDPALDPGPLGLSPEVMAAIPSKVLRIAVPGRTLAESLPYLQATYCGTMAYEIEHISTHEERVWLREKIESGAYRQPLPAEQRRALLRRLTEVEALEKFLHKAYLGQKRFSIEGVDMLVPMLDLTIERAAESGARDVVIGMAHRGRLNVLAHTVGRPYETIFAEFEGGRQVEGGQLTPEGGTGDVKYHHGAEGAYVTSAGKAVTVSLAPNPSHLEFVSPVVDGRARAKQTQRRGREAHHDPTAALPVTIHGDAAFAGQGVVAETLNLGALKGYRTGGTLHVITNNQVGFTTDMEDARSTRYASDLAKGFDIPIIHINADDAEACLSAVRLAMAYRDRFHQDVLIDLVGYRRHGHNEGDEPAYTQPVMYQRIRALPTVRERYARTLIEAGVLTEEESGREAEQAYQRLVDIQQAFKTSTGRTVTKEREVRLSGAGQEVETALAPEFIRSLNDQLLSWPEGFTVHPKLGKQLERRRAALTEGGIDWAHAEALALASLLTEGVPLRLTGQDTERGTFSQRHLVLHDAKTGQSWAPIQKLPGALAPLELHNSPLSELATLGFEYGYSAAAPEVLVLWEAQFGDFINGAQVIVDQFLSAGLSKWGLTTRLTLLLPHGYEGQGPEHSSARLERFLQLAAEGNIRVANPTTPGQYFHLLRRQARRTRQRPLVIMTPKSLLRLPQANSSLEDLSTGTWRPVLDDPALQGDTSGVDRVVLCSGKVYYDLLTEAQKMGEGRPAIVRLEQLYSFPWSEMRAVLGRYGKLEELVWVQEEPRNMGAWTYVETKLHELAPKDVDVVYVGRPERASPAEGYPAAHAAEQGRIIREALESGDRRRPVPLPTVAAAGEAKG
ncbi:MAG TPA: multifunctional oxoglutarate decarboxylase/oxoglutarate dehydrogenase thiamine pyrophosphate-binding subunit/dihydrolipoyllysine-residue succinyltransferase subunit [Gemmatimonadales bacterium]|nr:multifunctional oxoglutarate decarboxylase/oxoglutarate dehydrogenase thiamine pyrophosphate-binding subunit/dihydrolipoyllysine-residue succinyltransferase subunit [Gemmatimonadales bacterium]